MANYKLVDADQLDADMTAVAESIRTKGGTTEQLPWPDGFKAAVEAISTGVEVQKKSGRFITNESGKATVDCGFAPDFVFFHNNGKDSSSGEIYSTAAAFSEEQRSGKMDLCMWGSSNIFDLIVTRTNRGFTVESKKFDLNFSYSTASNVTYYYTAVKYT